MGRPDRNRYFQRMFEQVMRAWQRGELEHPAVESFAAFHARVSAAFSEVTGGGGQRTVLVFTSGGPIGVSVQRVLSAPPETAMRLNYRVKNASITEFVFSDGRISLDGFNAIEHLPRELRTFR